MKMYFKLILILFVLISTAFSQDFDGIKIYVNPGHGGNDPANDRYIPETGFWESESNLTKGLYLRELLQAHNAVVFMSRTQNRDEDDLPLSQIDADANANNVDYFHSIHSNAANEKANYTLLLYKEDKSTKQPVDPLSRSFGTVMADEIYRIHRTTASYNRGDYSFLGFNLGVLNTLNYSIMRGTLSEGSFHDYLPESFRLMSLDYRRHESIAMFRAFVSFLGLGTVPTGVVAGIIRDNSDLVDYSYNYNSELPNDRYKAINNAKITLLPEGREYITDYNENGFFMFDNVEPGSYQVVIESGFHEADTVNVTAVAGRTVFADAKLLALSDKAPQIFGHSPANNSNDIPTNSEITIQFSQPMDRTVTVAGVHIDPAINAGIAWLDGDQKMVFTLLDTLQRNTQYQVVVTDSVKNKKAIATGKDSTFIFTTSNVHIAPQVLSYFPPATMDSVIIYSDLKIEFDMPMRVPETNAAFMIDPATEGTFEWNSSNTEMTFIPDNPLQRRTEYHVTLSILAQNSLGASLDSAVTFSFMTRQRNELEVLSSYPKQNEIEVSIRPQINILFSGVFNLSSILGKYTIKDDAGNAIAAKGLNLVERDGNGLLYMETRTLLLENTNYTISFAPGIVDVNGLVLTDTAKIHFKTEKNTWASGNVVDNFEVYFGWTNPAENPTSAGLVKDETSFSLSSAKMISGTYSGKLEYEFSDSLDGVCRLQNEERILIPNKSDSEFGIWVYGDYSFNAIELWFDDDSLSGRVGYNDTLDWGGWKLIRFPISAIKAKGTLFLQSFVLKQTAEGQAKGTLYLDDIQYDIQLTDLKSSPGMAVVPGRLELYQNYPNPFNPVTNIRYALPKRGHINLAVYNILGQKITTLVDEVQNPGLYTVEWDAAQFSTGIYFCKIQSAEGQIAKKLFLIK